MLNTEPFHCPMSSNLNGPKRRRKIGIASLAVQTLRKQKEESIQNSGSSDELSTTSGCIGSSDDILGSNSRTSGSIEDPLPSTSTNDGAVMRTGANMHIVDNGHHLNKSQSVFDVRESKWNEHGNFESYIDKHQHEDVHYAPVETFDDSAIAVLRKQSTQRNLLLGPGGGVLIGTDELKAVLPNQTADIFVATWNLNGSVYMDTDSLQQVLHHGQNVDIYAFAIQESPPPGSGFRRSFVVLMQKVVGQSFVKLKMVHMGTQLLVIFIKRTLLWFCSEPNTNAFRMKRPNLLLGAYSRTKGAIAIVFNLFKTSILFISCHLSCTTAVTARVEDYWNILHSLRFPDYRIPNKFLDDPIGYFDKVFWFGDLNFRMDETRSTLELLLDQMLVGKELVDQSIFNSDQLTREREAGTIFNDFYESRISFPPTYKYDVGTHILDTSSKQRPPAYTDRILFREKSGSPEGIKCLLYHSAHNVCLSDHKPVFALFRTKVNPGKNLSVPITATVLSSDVQKIHDKAFISGNSTTSKISRRSKLCIIC